MTRDEAVKTILSLGSRVVTRLRATHPQWLCDCLAQEAAEDAVDDLIALGLLKVDQPCPSPPSHNRNEAEG